MTAHSEKKCIMIVAGEASGDLHGAKLVRAMLAQDPSLFFVGIGGSRLRSAGVRIVVDAAQLAVVGITEVFAKGLSLLKGVSSAKRLLKTLAPDLLILIDFPDFNLHLAAKAKRIGIPVLYYISPQIWAWRQGRIRQIKSRVDHMAVILPFEEAFYRQHQVPATFVGHPLLDEREPVTASEKAPQKIQAPLIGLLPGSRDKEVLRHLPVMLQCATLLCRHFKQIRFVVSRAPTVSVALFDDIMGEFSHGEAMTVFGGPVGEIFKQSRMVIAVSGTVTLEAALTGTPTVIIYKVSPVSYWIGKRLVRVEHIGLINLIAEKRIVPELVQQEVTPENIFKHVEAMLQNPEQFEETVAELLRAAGRLGKPGASKRTAALAMKLIRA
jgi:lipid-A-disaccharide synthase